MLPWVFIPLRRVGGYFRVLGAHFPDFGESDSQDKHPGAQARGAHSGPGLGRGGRG